MRGDHLPPASPALPPDGDSLLERLDELASLRSATQAVLAGTGRIVLIEGQPGIGKSRMLRETGVIAAAAGFNVLTARGSELEREFAFGAVRQLFERTIAESGHGARWLDGPARSATPVFEPPTGDSAPDNASFSVLHGLYWLVVNMTGPGPLLLAIDDLHWCDRASLRFIAYLARRLEGLPVLVAVCTRPAELGVDRALLGEIVQDAGITQLRLAPFGIGPTRAFVAHELGAVPAPAFAAACHRSTGGNPLLLHELLRAMQAEGVPPDAAHIEAIAGIGPHAVSRTVLVRLSRLPADAIVVARAVAVLGESASLLAVSELAGLDRARSAMAVEELVRAEILGGGLPLEFVHPLVREAIYQELVPAQREVRHAEAALLLRAAGAPDEQIAAHLLVVSPGTTHWVVEVLRQAARAAMRKGAPESAITYLRRALAEPPEASERHRVLWELGMAEALVSAPPAAEHLAAARRALATPAERGRAALTLARMLLFTRPPGEAMSVAGEAVRELGDDQADLRLALEAMALYAVHFGAAEPEGRARRLVEARQNPSPGGAGARMLTAVAAWDWALTGGPAAACSELALAALRGGELVAADPGFMTIVAVAVLVLADRDEALPVWEQALAEALRQGSLDAASGVHIWRGWTWLQRGDLAEAEGSLRQALDESRLWNRGEGTALPYTAGLLARTLLECGDLDGARQALAGHGNPVPGSDGDNLCRQSRVALLLAEGRLQEALDEADRYVLSLRRVVNPGWAPWRSLKAEVLSRMGRGDEALELLREDLEVAKRWGAPGTVGGALRRLGSRGGGLELIEQAVETTAGTPAKLEHAKALASLGIGLRHARRPSDARAPLRRALELAIQCGAAPLAALARTELLATGARPLQRPLTGAGSLTASERRVADLAATGKTNREIAEQLYITPKTVEIHLSSAYRKLDIRSRQELAGALAGPAEA